MRGTPILLTLLICVITIACQDEESFSECGKELNQLFSANVGDTVSMHAVICIDGDNSCTQGFDNYYLYFNYYDLPFRAKTDSGSDLCLSNAFYRNGLLVRIKAIILPIPTYPRVYYRPIKLLLIESE